MDAEFNYINQSGFDVTFDVISGALLQKVPQAGAQNGH